MARNYMNFVYIEQHGFIFAYVPKAACTNWKCLLRRMAGHDDWLDHKLAHDRANGGLRRIDFTTSDIDLLYDESIKKYAMVRDPYSRTLSAYLSKIERRLPVKPEGEGNTFDKVVRSIDKFRRNSLGETAFPKITFEVFLLWLRMSKSWFVDGVHWAPQATLLRQPEIKFDFVGRVENITEDSARIFDAIGYKGSFPFQADVNFKPTNATSKAAGYYNVKREFLAHSLFERDFEAFGYDERVALPLPAL